MRRAVSRIVVPVVSVGIMVAAGLGNPAAHAVTVPVVVGSISLAGTPEDIAVNPCDGTVFVAQSQEDFFKYKPGLISAIDPASLSVAATSDTWSAATAVAIYGPRAYVTSHWEPMTSSRVQVFDTVIPEGSSALALREDEKTDPPKLHGRMTDVTVVGSGGVAQNCFGDGEGGDVFITSAGYDRAASYADRLWTARPALGEFVAKDGTDVGARPEGVAFNPINGFLYVANGGSGTVSVVDATVVADAPQTLIEEIKLSAGRVDHGKMWPTGVAVGHDGLVYVVNQGDNSVSVIETVKDSETGVVQSSVVALIPVGSIPSKVAVNPIDGVVYVTNSDGTLTLIEGTASSATINVDEGKVLNSIAFAPNGTAYVGNRSDSSIVVLK